jgi:hypothetical protein
LPYQPKNLKINFLDSTATTKITNIVQNGDTQVFKIKLKDGSFDLPAYTYTRDAKIMNDFVDPSIFTLAVDASSPALYTLTMKSSNNAAHVLSTLLVNAEVNGCYTSNTIPFTYLISG